MALSMGLAWHAMAVVPPTGLTHAQKVTVRVALVSGDQFVLHHTAIVSVKKVGSELGPLVKVTVGGVPFAPKHEIAGLEPRFSGVEL